MSAAGLGAWLLLDGTGAPVVVQPPLCLHVDPARAVVLRARPLPALTLSPGDVGAMLTLTAGRARAMLTITANPEAC